MPDNRSDAVGQHTPASLADVLERDYFPMPNGAKLYLAEHEWRMIVNALRSATAPTGQREVAEEARAIVGKVWHSWRGNNADAQQALKAVDDDLIAYAATLPQQPAVAEGWVLVPREPTDAMILAGAQSPGKKWSHITAESVVHRYRAMLAAAPKQEGKEENGK